jgi:hypothetical protein
MNKNTSSPWSGDRRKIRKSSMHLQLSIVPHMLWQSFRTRFDKNHGGIHETLFIRELSDYIVNKYTHPETLDILLGKYKVLRQKYNLYAEVFKGPYYLVVLNPNSRKMFDIEPDEVYDRWIIEADKKLNNFGEVPAKMSSHSIENIPMMVFSVTFKLQDPKQLYF